MQDFTIDQWTVSPKRNLVLRNDVQRHLEPRVMDLLVYLARHAGRVVSRDQLIGAVWPHAYVSDSALQSAVSTLRKALDDDPRSPSILETIPKRGYRLIAASSAAKPIVAVLPFENLTGLEEQRHFADGVTDALISELGRHGGLNVISRQSVMAFRESTLALPDIAARIGATVVVHGSVLPENEHLSATVQLVDAASDMHLWTETFRLVPGTLFIQQRRVAATIAARLTAGEEQPTAAASRQDLDPAAVNHYLLGRFHWYKLSPEHFPAALRHFEKAIEIEPGFSAAYAGVADAWGAMGYWGAMPATEVRRPVREYTDRALDIDPYNAEARMLAGAYAFHIAHDWPAARSHFESAIECNPSLSHAHFLYGLFLATIGDASARREFDSALHLDPLNPVVHIATAMCAVSEDRTDAAIHHLQQALELVPGFPPGLELRADMAWQSHAANALELEQQLWLMDEGVSQQLADLAAASDSDRLAGAAALLEERQSYVSPRIIARLLGLAGETGKAIDVLCRAIDGGDLMQADLVLLMPAFAEVRKHSRFAEVLDRLGMPRAAR